MTHLVHLVEFHISQDFGCIEAQERWDFYSLMGAPSSIYDGGYEETYYTDESKINASGTRAIHMIEMYLSKSIEGSTLHFSGNVTNLESHTFNGFILVFVTENHLIDSQYGATWNFVFRDRALNKSLSLIGSSTDTFSGAWDIASNVRATSIQLVAAVFDYDSGDSVHSWPYAVQSVCDVCGHSGGKSVSLATDLNKDGIVNILDISLVAKAFGSKPGDLNWNAVADVNQDGIINILDISKVAKDYGRKT